ncbi:MAG TPA: class I SAM-dependent methyltransferase [Alphaproteobacteria bacterium]|nr:class I SAM-dependent methyltransferase [Alphaproteobacteria bacterium]
MTLQAGVIIILAMSLALTAVACLLATYLVYKLRQMHVTLYGAHFRLGKLSTDITQNLQRIEQLSHELRLPGPLPLLRGWAASPDVLLVLTRHVRRASPEVVVECGSGVSTIVLAQAARLNDRGHVYSLEHDADFAQRGREWLQEFGLADWATVIHAPLVETADGGDYAWYDIRNLPRELSIDLLFVDGPPADTPQPTARYLAGPMLFPRLSPAGVVILDDADRPGETEVVRRWMKEFPQFRLHRHHCEKGCYELRPDIAVSA